MRHFPVFLDLRGRRVVVSGAGETALAKIRLLLKTEARVSVIGEGVAPQIRALADAGRLALWEREIAPGDALCAALVYGANDDPARDARAVEIGRAAGALTNIVDHLEASQFITPAIVDRDPVTVAIGTEGAAPVLARKIKADLEGRLPSTLGRLARIGQAFRGRAEALPQGRPRRRFWSRFYFERGPKALAEGRAETALEGLLAEELGAAPEAGRVHFVGAGPGDPELLTQKARRLLHEADVVVHDRLVPQPILELARREARLIEVGKTPYGPSWSQDAINALLVAEAAGAVVVRLKSGDAGIFGRLGEEIDAVAAAGIAFDIVPGITAASAAGAAVRTSLTARGRNSGLTIVTGHDAAGFAEQDWQALARPGAVAAIYMGVRAARFVEGRLLMHGAAGETPVTAVENASRPDERVLETSLQGLGAALSEWHGGGPVVLLFGLRARMAGVLGGAAPLADRDRSAIPPGIFLETGRAAM